MSEMDSLKESAKSMAKIVCEELRVVSSELSRQNTIARALKNFYLDQSGDKPTMVNSTVVETFAGSVDNAEPTVESSDVVQQPVEQVEQEIGDDDGIHVGDYGDDFPDAPTESKEDA